jgi:hypothetical protein
MLGRKIIVEWHPSKIDKARRVPLTRAIPYRDPRQQAERFKAVPVIKAPGAGTRPDRSPESDREPRSFKAIRLGA